MLQKNLNLITTKEAAQMMGLTVNTLEKYRCYYGKGPKYIRISKRAIRYRVSDVEAFLQERSGYTSTSDYE